MEGFWRFVEGLGHPVDAAALNVGISLGGAFVDNDLEDDFRLIAIRITGLVHMAKRVARHMVANGGGRILVTSSVSATTPTPYETVYGPSKAFGFSFAESLREELRGSGVSVTALLPGATDSDFHANAGMQNIAFGDNRWKNDKTEVARQGVEALMNGDDHVVGGATRPPSRRPSTTERPPSRSRPRGWPSSPGRGCRGSSRNLAANDTNPSTGALRESVADGNNIMIFTILSIKAGRSRRLRHPPSLEKEICPCLHR